MIGLSDLGWIAPLVIAIGLAMAAAGRCVGLSAQAADEGEGSGRG